MSVPSNLETSRFPLPAPFLQRMERLIAPEMWPAFVASFDLPRRTALRINPLRISVEEARSHLEHRGISRLPIPWSETALVMPTVEKSQLSRWPEVTAGQFYLQSLSSQLAALALAPQPGDQVLDLASAPGGKAAHLAALMNNQGWLSCVEPIRSRFFRMQANLKMQGVTIARFFLMDGRAVGRKVGPRFDRVLLDAPCSGEARFFTSEVESFRTWSLRKIRETSRKQAGLLQSAFDSLRPGGRLLYSTCSFAPEENEALVARLLEANPAHAMIVPLNLLTTHGADPSACHSPATIPFLAGWSAWEGQSFPCDIVHTARIFPNAWYDGFFLALIEKTA